MRGTRRVLVVSAVVALLAIPGVALGKPGSTTGPTRYVNAATGSDFLNDCKASAHPCQTIQHAIDQANPGDTILVAQGTYIETVDVNKPVNVKGAGAGTTTIQNPPANTDRPVVEVGAPCFIFGCNLVTVTIQGFTITGGNNSSTGADDFGQFCSPFTSAGVCGGGIYNGLGSQLTLTAVTVSGNTAYAGGGVFNDHFAQLTVNSSLISGNTAEGFDSNFVAGSGGGVFNGGGYDYAQFCDGPCASFFTTLTDSVTLINTTVSNNTATAAGGGLLNFGGNTMSVQSSTITGNNLSDGYIGAGIANVGFLTLNKSFVTNNGWGDTAPFLGGGIFSSPCFYEGCPTIGSGATQLTRTNVTGNRSVEGGGIYNGGTTFSLLSSNVNGNTAFENGGGIFNGSQDFFFGSPGQVSLSSSVIQSNTAAAAGLGGNGGGVYNDCGATLTRTKTPISSNTPDQIFTNSSDCFGPPGP